MRLAMLAFVLLATFTAQPVRAQTSDVIVVLGGSGGIREVEAARLYAAGFAPRVLVSGSGPSLESAVRALRNGGVSDSALTINTLPANANTYTEAQSNLALVQSWGVRSVLIVSHEYHLKRARWSYEHVAACMRYAVTVTTAGIPGGGWRERMHEALGMMQYEIVYAGCG